MYYKLIIVSLILAGCSNSNLSFDGGEYSKFIDIKYYADKRQTVCESKASIKETQEILKTTIDKEMLYAQYRSQRKLVYSTTKNLNDIIDGFYQDQNMSKAYCLSKLENISTAATIILETLGSFK
jgi:hypothetical protein